MCSPFICITTPFICIATSFIYIATPSFQAPIHDACAKVHTQGMAKSIWFLRMRIHRLNLSPPLLAAADACAQTLSCLSSLLRLRMRGIAPSASSDCACAHPIFPDGLTACPCALSLPLVRIPPLLSLPRLLSCRACAHHIGPRDWRMRTLAPSLCPHCPLMRIAAQKPHDFRMRTVAPSPQALLRLRMRILSPSLSFASFPSCRFPRFQVFAHEHSPSSA